MSHRTEKMSSWIRERVALFFSLNLKVRGGIITVSRVELDSDLTKAKILITVYPEKFENEVVMKLKNLKNNFVEYVKKDFKMKKLPSFKFEIDEGEKKRMKIEEILAKK